MAMPTMVPPSTSHQVGVAKPAKTVVGAAIWNSMAQRKNSSVVSGSGSRLMAQHAMVNTTRMPVRTMSGLTPSGNGMYSTAINSATRPMISSGMPPLRRASTKDARGAELPPDGGVAVVTQYSCRSGVGNGRAF